MVTKKKTIIIIVIIRRHRKRQVCVCVSACVCVRVCVRVCVCTCVHMRASVVYIVCVSIVCYRGRRRRISFKTLTRDRKPHARTRCCRVCTQWWCVCIRIASFNNLWRVISRGDPTAACDVTNMVSNRTRLQAPIRHVIAGVHNTDRYTE